MTEVVVSKNAVPIRLTDERWAHITEEHNELAGLRLNVLKQWRNHRESWRVVKVHSLPFEK
jgi:hypothetical protein